MNQTEVVEGTVALARVAAVEGREVPEGLWIRAGEARIPLFPCGSAPAKPRPYCGLVPAPLGYERGSLEIELRQGDEDGRPLASVSLKVVEGKYRKENLRVDPAKVTLSEKDQARVEREREILGAVFENWTPEPLWDGPFVRPARGRITSRFGNKRMYNGELKGFHTGVDLAGDRRTLVRSANRGVVRVADNFFFAGNLVVVDHGLGLYTAYAHLSEMRVAVGDRVAKGQVLGRAGATGRVTGPHLHWVTRVSAVLVDPLQLETVFASLPQVSGPPVQ